MFIIFKQSSLLDTFKCIAQSNYILTKFHTPLVSCLCKFILQSYDKHWRFKKLLEYCQVKFIPQYYRRHLWLRKFKVNVICRIALMYIYNMQILFLQTFAIFGLVLQSNRMHQKLGWSEYKGTEFGRQLHNIVQICNTWS